jgi:hypothetical protein
MNLESIKQGDVIIIDQDGHPPWAERVMEVTPQRVRTRPEENYDISSVYQWDKESGKLVGAHYTHPVARPATPEDNLAVLRLEISEQDWDEVPVETLRKIRDLLA